MENAVSVHYLENETVTATVGHLCQNSSFVNWLKLLKHLVHLYGMSFFIGLWFFIGSVCVQNNCLQHGQRAFQPAVTIVALPGI